MKNNIFIRSTYFLFIAMLINACDDSKGNTTPSLTGTAQKGGYTIDSSISFFRLSLEGQTLNERVDDRIINNQGGFATHIPWNDWTKLTVTGAFYSELNNKKSATALSLNNITDIGDTSGSVNINLFTHLVAARTLVLTHDGKKLTTAKKSALLSLSKLFGLKTNNIEHLNLAKNSERDNANLLLLSAGFLASSDASSDLSTSLLTLTDDFADNGLIDGNAKALFKKISSYAGGKNTLENLSNNLKKMGYKTPPTSTILTPLPSWIIPYSTNTPPTANAGADRTITQGDNITLVGTGSDSDGTIISYAWYENSQLLRQTKSLPLKNLSTGTHILTLTVTDDKNGEASDNVTIIVNKKPDNIPDIKVDIKETQCTTKVVFGETLHLKLNYSFQGGMTGSGPLHVTRYTSADCSGSTTALPSYLPANTTITYKITNITDNAGSQRTGTMTFIALGQVKSRRINIDNNGNVSF